MHKATTKFRPVKLITPLDEGNPILSDALVSSSPPVSDFGSTRGSHLGAWLEDSAHWTAAAAKYQGGRDHASLDFKPRLPSITDVSESRSESGSSAKTQGVSPSISQRTVSRQNSSTSNGLYAEDVHAAARRSIDQSRSVSKPESQSQIEARAKQKASKFSKFFW